MIFPGYPFRCKPEACTSYNYKYYGMGEENMIDKLLKAISLKDEDCIEELDNASQKTSFIITMIIFALIGAAAVGYLFYMRNSTKYKYDDSLTVSKNGTHIVYDESGAYLMHQEKVLSDTYMAIEKDPFSDYCRVIDKDGLIGFIAKKDGRETIFPQYTEASPMKYGSSCVNSGKGYYYVSENGKYMTGYYEEADSWGRQGTMARVKKSDGWAVIDRQGTVLIDKCDSIDSLPFLSDNGTAVRDGHVLLLHYSDSSDESASVQIVKEFEHFTEVTEVFNSQFAIVKGADGYGAVDLDGNMIVPAIYKDLTWDSYKIPGEVFKKEIIFKGKKVNDRLDVTDWKPQTN